MYSAVSENLTMTSSQLNRANVSYFFLLHLVHIKMCFFSVVGCKCTRVHSVHLFLFGFFLLYFQHAHVRAHSNENSLFFLVRPLWVMLKLRVEGKKWFPAFYLNWSKIFSWLKVVFRILIFLCFGGHRFFICYYYCWVFTFLKWIKKCKFMIKYHY